MADGGRSPKDIGKRLVALREAMQLNQTAFAKLVDLSQPAVNNYERGLRRPELDAALKIRVRTGVSLDWIYEGDRSGLPDRLLKLLPDMSEKFGKTG